MISETLQNARDYENKYGVFIQKEERPVFHATPKVGWMNDPNGFSVYQGKYPEKTLAAVNKVTGLDLKYYVLVDFFNYLMYNLPR